MLKLDLCGKWEMISSAGRGTATVPGDYYSDLFQLGFIPEPYFKDNTALLKEIPLNPIYKRRFSFETGQCCDCAVLRFYGIDTLAKIYLNEIYIGSVDNMHRVWEFEVLKHLKNGDNILCIEFASPVKYVTEQHKKRPLRGADDTILGFQALRKAHYMMGWDFAPELSNVGIFRPVEIELVKNGHITATDIIQNTDADEAKLTLIADVEITAECLAEIGFRITAPDGRVFETTHSEVKGVGKNRVCFEYSIPNPSLWWPNGLGKQPLYTVEAVLSIDGSVTDSAVKRIGLRSLKLCTETDGYGREFCFEINGYKIFAKGANYVPEDSLPSRRSDKRTRKLLTDCVKANFNMIRVWGGGFYPDDWFFDICDELGLLVWQDFMFACCFIDDDPRLLDNIAIEVKENIERFGYHACLALLCGNNEIEEAIAEWEDWVADDRAKQTYLQVFENTIPEIIKQSDCTVDYTSSSPTSGGGFEHPSSPDIMDSHSWQVWHKSAPYESYRDHYYRFCSEMGFESFPSLKTLSDVTDDKSDLNIFSYEMEYRQRCADGNRLIIMNMAQHYRLPNSFEKLIYLSQLMQADSMRCGIEHMRRNRGRCMGALYWQINDCWPGVSWSGIDYNGRWKILHYASREFYAPQTLILNNYEGRVVFSVSNETFKELKGKIRWSLLKRDFSVVRSGEFDVNLDRLSSGDIGDVDFSDLSYNQKKEIFLMATLTDETGCELMSQTLLFVPSKYFRYTEPQIDAKLHKENETYYVTVTANQFAHNIWLEFENTDCLFSKNSFSITSKEPVKIKLECNDASEPDINSLHILCVNRLDT